ncbi:Tet(A)/Tet(B)/Tet(C) family tetracycline efflux MFS transporter [Enterobacter roggenkampii]|uniref:Tet(A)/Tet(B)/Tet(C) family tetracycline efflux MFS transporter n=1 Tax=Enterobacter cloacae complex TaxID=354276 RepID=UPI003C12BC20
MSQPAIIALIVVSLDAMGLGIIMPALPALLRELMPAGQIAGHYGAFLSLYALMQVIFAPLLGQLSDSYGRRPVLLTSLAAATIDYAVMASAPVLWVLYIGRMVSGITGATGAVAASIIVDTTQERLRTRWFGYMGACYGAGMIAGPALGGIFCNISIHAPFIAAALFNGFSFIITTIYLRHSNNAHDKNEKRCNLKLFPKYQPGNILRKSGLLLIVFFIIQLIGQLPAALWVIYGEDRFQWNTITVSLSLTAFGAAHTICQAFLIGPLSAWMGDRKTLILGILADAGGFILLAFTMRGWMIFPIIPLLAIGGISMPLLQAMLSKNINSNEQGALQGVLTSLTNISAIAGPIFFTTLYFVTTRSWNGWVWLIGGAFYIPCILILLKYFNVKETP